MHVIIIFIIAIVTISNTITIILNQAIIPITVIIFIKPHSVVRWKVVN